MKKNYIKPAVQKVEIDVQIIRMYTREGFMQVFWETLQAMRKENPKISHEAVFDILNEKYRTVFGEGRYKCYDSFRQMLNK
jgi:hypothetical protein